MLYVVQSAGFKHFLITALELRASGGPYGQNVSAHAVIQFTSTASITAQEMLDKGMLSLCTTSAAWI